MKGRIFLLLLISFCVLEIAISADVVQRFKFANFNNNAGSISVVNGAKLSNGVIRLTDPQGESLLLQGQAWFKQKVQLWGFNTTFQFSISEGFGEGLTFMIQAISSEIHSGVVGSGLGYGDNGNGGGIPNSIAIELDPIQTLYLGDPDKPHISVHTNPDKSEGNSANETYSLKRTIGITPFANDGQIHTIRVTYIPINATGGSLQVYMDDIGGAPIDIEYIPLTEYVTLDEDNGWSAYVGFTAGTSPTNHAYHDILSWEFDFLGVTSDTSVVLDIPTVTAGSPTILYIQGYDQFEHKMIVGGGNFTASLSSQPDASLNITDLQNGTYSIELITTKSGDGELTVLINDTPLIHGPYSVTIVPGPIGAQNCYATESNGQNGLTGGTAGEEHQFTIQLVDEYGNTITESRDVTIQATLDGPSSITATTQYDDEGRYTASYTLDKSGSYNLVIKVDGVLIKEGEKTINISPAGIDGSATEATGEGLIGSIAGSDATFQLQMFDQYGNKITQPGNPNIQVTFNPNESDNVDVSGPNGEGVFTVSYRINKAGDYTMNVEVNQIYIHQGPFSISVVPDGLVYPPNCFAYGAQLNVTTAGESSSFYIQLVDRLGNLIKEEKNDLSWTIQFISADISNLNPPAPIYTDNGIYEAIYNVTIAGSYSVHVLINGTEIKDGPFNLYANPGPTFGPTSNIVGAATETYTDDKNTFWIDARDRYYNFRGKGGDIFSVNIKDHVSGSEAKNVDLTDLKNGTYACTYVLKSSGEYSVSVAYNGLAVSGTPFTVKCKWSGLSTAATAGIGISCVVVVGAALFGFWFYRKRLRKRRLYKAIGETS